MPYSHDLPLSRRKIARCREIAQVIGEEVAEIVHAHSTVGTERAVLRLLGFNGALEKKGLIYPVSNYIVDQLTAADRLQEGALYWIVNALIETGADVPSLEKKILGGIWMSGRQSPIPITWCGCNRFALLNRASKI